MNLDDLEIIRIVQANPCLYVKDIKLYKNIDRKHCWEQVGAVLTNPRTGEAVQKRWDSLRTMFVRAHRKRMEYVPSGSAACDGLEESDGIDFVYYAEMSFLIPHYKPRTTRSNMKTVTSIQIPSSTSVSDAADGSVPITTHSGDSVWNLDLTESMSIAGTDDSCFSSVSSKPSKSPSTSSPTSSPTPASETVQMNLNSVQFVPFSPSAVKATNFKSGTSGSASGLGSYGTSIAPNRKFKSKADTEVVVPPSDNFSKRKRNAEDAFFGKTTQMMDRMASTVETIVSSRQTEASPLPEDSALVSLSATIANLMQDVPKEKRRKCLYKILQVIGEFAD